MIAIIDYKAGNLTSVASAVQALGHPCCITSDPAKIAAADRVIFPGVGAARAAMQNLRDMNLVDCLRALATNGKPFLGICLGYQILFEFSEEDNVECLGILPGRVVRFPQGMTEGDTRPLKIPQMGWNEARFNLPHPVAAGLAAGSRPHREALAMTGLPPTSAASAFPCSMRAWFIEKSSVHPPWLRMLTSPS